MRLHLHITLDYTLQCRYWGDTKLLWQMWTTVSRVDGHAWLAWTGSTSIREPRLWRVDIWTLAVTCYNSHNHLHSPNLREKSKNRVLVMIIEQTFWDVLNCCKIYMCACLITHITLTCTHTYLHIHRCTHTYVEIREQSHISVFTICLAQDKISCSWLLCGPWASKNSLSLPLMLVTFILLRENSMAKSIL